MLRIKNFLPNFDDNKEAITHCMSMMNNGNSRSLLANDQ